MATTNADLIFIDRDSAEWQRMWEHLAERCGARDDYAELDPMTGEAWQYLGTTRRGSILIHEFRHRRRPYRSAIAGVSHALPHSGRVYLNLVASAEFHEANDLYCPDAIAETVWSAAIRG